MSLSPSPAAAAVADLNPLLLDAKNIYVNQLAEAMGPYMLRTIESLYEDTLEAGSSKVLLRFQAKLREIPKWNTDLINQHAVCLESKVPYLGDLIAAAFVAYVKVMSSIKLRPDKPNIRLKLPTNAAFVHKAFVNVARDFYEAPHMGQRPATEYAGLRAAVERTIRDMLPLQDILRAYLGSVVDNQNTVSPMPDDHGDDDDDCPAAAPSPAMFNHEEEDDDDGASPSPDECPPPPPPQPQPQPYQQPQPQPFQQPQPQPFQQPQPQPFQQPQPQPCGDDTKTVSIPPVPASDRDADLFSDAGDVDWKHA